MSVIIYPYIKDSKVEVCRGRGVDRHSTQERKLQVGREGRGRGNRHSTQEIKLQVGGGRLTFNSGKKVAGGEGRVDRHSTQERSCRWGGRGGQSTFNSGKLQVGRGGWSTFNLGKKVAGGGVNRQSTWKGSTRTLQGLPLTMGGGIDSQLGKDPQIHCKDYLLTMLILGGGNQWSTWKGFHGDLARITSDNVDPGGVNWQ